MPARGLNWLTMGISVASRGTTDSEGERVQADWKLLAEQLLQERSPSEQSAKAALEWLAEREGKTLAELAEELRRAGDGSQAGSRTARKAD